MNLIILNKRQLLISYTNLIIITSTLISCGNNSSKNNAEDVLSNDTSVKVGQQIKVEEIAGVYSGTDNVGMESRIILNHGGTLIIHASVGDGTPDYGWWTGTADALSLYHKGQLGNDEFIGSATVSDMGLQIKGGKFYKRQ